LIIQEGDTSAVVPIRYIKKANYVFINRENLKNKSLILKRRTNILKNQIKAQKSKISHLELKIIQLNEIIKLDNKQLKLMKERNNKLIKDLQQKNLIIMGQRIGIGVLLGLIIF
jgi:SMC interacting uncharacterized protein involved in chromosome segregation